MQNNLSTGEGLGKDNSEVLIEVNRFGRGERELE